MPFGMQGHEHGRGLRIKDSGQEADPASRVLPFPRLDQALAPAPVWSQLGAYRPRAEYSASGHQLGAAQSPAARPSQARVG